MRTFKTAGGAIAAMALLLFVAPAWAQRGRGGMRASAGARFASPSRVFVPATRSFGRDGFTSGFRPFSNRFPYSRRRGYFAPIWGGTVCYVDTADLNESSCLGYSSESYYDTSYYDPPQPVYTGSYQQTPIIVVQLPPPAPAQNLVTVSSPTPQEPPVDPFVLVRLDGQQIKAVAYTIADDRVTYITSTGMRRSFPLAELDKDATRDQE